VHCFGELDTLVPILICCPAVCRQVELYNAAGVKIPSSSITASSSTAWDGGLTYVASYCNDGILTTEYLPSVCTNGVCRDVWTNLCHTGRVDSNPTMTFTYPCQQGLSKAVLYNFRYAVHIFVHAQTVDDAWLYITCSFLQAS
jgi:hypothetical protein